MRRTMMVLGALIALLASAAPVGAVTLADATIDVHSAFAGTEGTFSADSDLLCDSGTTTDQTLVAGNGRAITFHNLKTFECADGSGTFTLRIQAKVKPCSATDSGVWNVAARHRRLTRVSRAPAPWSERTSPVTCALSPTASTTT